MWRSLQEPDPDTVHTLPVNDLIEHVDIGDDCPCGPTTKPVQRDDGSYGWLIVHHALDGREFAERGEQMPRGVD